MSEPSSSDPSDSGDQRDRHEGIGLGALSAGALSSLLDHLEARADLFRWEASEAKSRFVRRIAFLLIGLVMLLGAYAVGVAALVGWLAQSQGLSCPAAAGFVALGHLLLAVILLLLASRRSQGELFPDSVAELRRDRELLRRRSERSRPRDPKS
jgi:uncharacterized membrane protein YqjE